MSREVRRVPLDWKHPTEPNPYWRGQSRSFLGKVYPPSRLRPADQRFIGLCGDYPEALRYWQEEIDDVRARRGHRWTFDLEYHLTGYQGVDDEAPIAHPFYVSSDDGQTEIPIDVHNEDHLHTLVLAKVQGEKPNPAEYMPVWDVPDDELGWCLYETISEGTPVTPVFATADELVEHLATVGQDWDQEPLRREAAEAIVRTGHTLGTFVAMGGRILDSTKDADVIAGGAA